ncbi:MAG: hypothetical protein IJP89_05840 [Synergistaceae bacterium]|nr:hypothetical protein [Synergistaceae bacterium]
MTRLFSAGRILSPVSMLPSVLVGVSGIVNKELLYVGEKRFTELEEAQQIGLNLQLEAWNFLLVNVMQA